MKAHWENLHDWKIYDIRFELEQIWEFKKLLRKHPDDNLGEIFRDLIKACKKRLIAIVKEYAEIYGDKPNVRKIRSEVEGE